MQYIFEEPQSFYLEDLYTLSTCGHHYFLSKSSGIYYAFYPWQATERRNFVV